MSISESGPGSAEFVELSSENLPQIGSTSPQDLYIHLPNAHRYVRFVCRGEVWEQRKANMLGKHIDPRLYRLSAGDPPPESENFDERLLDHTEPSTVSKSPAVAISTPEEVRIFKAEIEAELKSIFVFLGDPQSPDSSQTLKSLERLVDKILTVVAPDVENLRGSILKNTKYLMVMADSAAITAIAVLFAMAHGFNSKKIFKDLSTAILLMDTSLAELPEELVLRYYKEREGLNRDEFGLIKAHPQKAYEATSKKLKGLPEPVLQLILNHQENYNSTGYPRGLRNEQLPPVIRSLNLAVNVFEIMKRENLNGNTAVDILTALEELKELDVEPHRRKHNQRLVTEAIHYVQYGN